MRLIDYLKLQRSPIKSVAIVTSLVFTVAACTPAQNDAETSNTSATETTLTEKETSQNATLSYVRSVEGIDEYQMSNGLKVLLFEDQSQPKTLVNITYRVGSVHENYGETGMAHLLEHMLFKGSTRYQDIDKEFNKRGMQVNATTWLDRTNYFELFEANDENLTWSLDMEADRMVNATFTKDQLDSEMTVVRNEMERGENNPFRILMARMDSTAFLWHNYANSTIGARSDVENFPFDKLRRFYDKHYRPDNAVLTVAGRFDKEKTLALIEKSFGKIAKPEHDIETLYTVEPTQDGERVVNLRRVGEVPLVAVQYHVPSALHQDTPAVQVLTQIMADQARGRLQKALVEKGIASGQWAVSFLRKDPSTLLMLAQGLAGQDIAELEAELIRQAEDIANLAITDQEVEQAKASILKETEEGLRNVTSVGMELSEFIAMGDYRYLFYFRDLVEKVSVEDVQRVATTYLVQSNRTLGRFIPTEGPVRAEITEASDITALLADYKGREAVAAGEVYDNNVDNIEARLNTFEWGVGTKVSVYPKKLRAGEVHITMEFPTGNESSLAGFEQDFEMIGGLLFSGNAKYSKADIASKLDALKASVAVDTGDVGVIQVRIQAVKEHLDETLAFVKTLLESPTFAPEEVEIDKKAVITGLQADRKEPSALAVDALRKAMNGNPAGHPNAYKSMDEKIAAFQAVTSERLKDVYAKHMSVAHGHIGVVGDLEPAAISSQLEQLFANFKGATPYQKLTTTRANPQGLDIWIETPDKANSQLFIGHRINLSPQHPDYPAAVIANSIFGGSGFASRLMQRIRVKEGYSYGTGSGLSVRYDEEQGMFYMTAIAAPENMKKVVEAYREEVEKAKTEGFTATEFSNAIDGEIKQLRVTWASDAYISRLLANNSELNRDLAWYKDFEAKLQGLTLEQVNAAFDKYIAVEQSNIFAAGDFAKSAK